MSIIAISSLLVLSISALYLLYRDIRADIAIKEMEKEKIDEKIKNIYDMCEESKRRKMNDCDKGESNQNSK